MEWKSVAKGLFAFMALMIATWVANSIERMTHSVEELNIKMAVVVKEVEIHDKRLTKLEDKR